MFVLGLGEVGPAKVEHAAGYEAGLDESLLGELGIEDALGWGFVDVEGALLVDRGEVLLDYCDHFLNLLLGTESCLKDVSIWKLNSHVRSGWVWLIHETI